jgi:hypothetical protein
VVAHSASGWFLPLVAARRRVRRIVFLAATVPHIGSSFLERLRDEPEMINPAWIGKNRWWKSSPMNSCYTTVRLSGLAGHTRLSAW